MNPRIALGAFTIDFTLIDYYYQLQLKKLELEDSIQHANAAAYDLKEWEFTDTQLAVFKENYFLIIWILANFLNNQITAYEGARSKFTDEYLKKHAELNWKADKDYVYPLEALNYALLDHLDKKGWKFSAINFSHPLYVRRCKKGHSYHVDVLSVNEIGSGSYGIVSKLIGTLTPTTEGLLSYATSEDGCAKLIPYNLDFTEKENFDQALNEFQLGLRLPHLGFKSFTIYNHPSNNPTDFSYGIRVRYLKGQSLENILNKDEEDKYNDINAISTNNRLELIRSFFEACQAVHDASIVHRDIKPENVIIDRTTSPVKARVIDFGLSRKRELDAFGKDIAEDGHYVGTPLSSAPEFFDHTCGLGPPNDYYSSVWPFVMLLRGNRNTVNMTGKTYIQAFNEAYLKSLNIKFENLFKGIIDLDDQHKKRLEELAYGLSKQNPSSRKNFIDGLNVLDDIKCERLFKQSDIYTQLKAAYKMGTNLREKWREYSKYGFDYSCSPSEFFTNLKKDLSECFVELEENEIVVKLFLEHADVQIFRGIHSKENALAKVDHLIHTYETLCNKLSSENGHGEIIKRIHAGLAKYNHPRTLDELAQYNIKLTKYLLLFTQSNTTASACWGAFFNPALRARAMQQAKQLHKVEDNKFILHR